MSELMCSQAKCRRKDEHIAELEADNRRLSEIEQRRIGEAITQADSIAELREQLAELRELVCNLYTLAKHCPSDKIADDFDFCTPLDHAEALLQERGE